MQFKQKLIYFALGCAFVVMGQVLVTVLTPKVTAQGKKASAEFDTVKVRSLQVMDKKGKVRAQLEVKRRPTIANSVFIQNIDDVIRVFNSAGFCVYRVGVDTDGASVRLSGKEPSLSVGTVGTGSVVIVGGHGRGGRVLVGNGKTCVAMVGDSNGGVVGVYGNDGKSRALISGGAVSVYGNDGEGRAFISSDEHGGRVEILGNDGKTHAAMGVSEYGHGAVNTWDKNGYKLR